MSVYCQESSWGQEEKALVAHAIDRTLNVAGGALFSGSAFPEVDATLTDDQESQALNLHYRNVNAPTNVLSFPVKKLPRETIRQQRMPPYLMGDIVLARGVIKRESLGGALGVSYEKHLARVVVHGVLHLLGCDHQEEEEAQEMVFWERRVCRYLETSSLLSPL